MALFLVSVEDLITHGSVHAPTIAGIRMSSYATGMHSTPLPPLMYTMNPFARPQQSTATANTRDVSLGT